MREKKSLLFTNIIYFIIITMFVVIRILSSLDVFKFSSSIYADIIFTVVVQGLILFAFPFFAYKIYKKKKSKEVFSDFKVKKISIKAVFISFLIGILVFIINIIVSSFFSSIISFFGYSNSGSSAGGTATYSFTAFVIDVILVCVLPAICEEFTHRGFLLTNYKKMGYKKAIIYSSILFGLLHLNINQFFYATVIGLILGFITIMSDSIVPAMIVHFTNNFISEYLTFATINKLPFGNLSEVIANFFFGGSTLLNLLLIILTIALVIFALMYLIAALFSETKVKQLNAITKSMALKQLKTDFMKDFDIEVEENLTEEEKEFKEMLFDNNVKFETKIIERPIDSMPDAPMNVKPTLVLPIEKLFKMYTKGATYQTKWYENLFLFASVFLGVIITIFTFIWGIL